MIAKDIQNYLDGLGMFGWKLGIDTIHTIMAALDHPQNSYRSLHLAGSNGKGSVARMLEAVLLQAGVRTGLYTSPHLVSPCERIRVAGKEILPATFDTLLREIQPVLTEQRATYFEALTALAFLYFAREKVEIAIVETGLGGRHDATNIIDPVCSVITSISLEHCNELGNTIAEIAGEKAGIVKANRPCVVGKLPAEAEDVIHTHCKKLGSPMAKAAEHVSVTLIGRSKWGGTEAQFEFAQQTCTAAISLSGNHQVGNAAVAIAALLQILPSAEIAAVLPAALSQVRYAGRMQIVAQNPVVLLDVAHNAESMTALADNLSETLSGSPIQIVIGLLKDKDIDAILRVLEPVQPRLFCATPRSNRALPAADLMQKARAVGLQAVCVESVAAGVAQARFQAGSDGTVLVTGSHYIVGEFLETVKI